MHCYLEGSLEECCIPDLPVASRLGLRLTSEAAFQSEDKLQQCINARNNIILKEAFKVLIQTGGLAGILEAGDHLQQR